MKLRLNAVIINIEESAIIVLFVCLLSKIARNYFSNYYVCFLFIAFHEFAHLTLAAMLGSCVRKINITLCGLSIALEKRFYGWKAIFIYLAGPLSNMLLALTFYKIPMVFEINICLALINLFPLEPLDGYNILCVILQRKNAKKLSFVFEIFLLILGIISIIKFCNISLILLLIYIKLEKLNSAKQQAYKTF